MVLRRGKKRDTGVVVQLVLGLEFGTSISFLLENKVNGRAQLPF